MSNLEAIIRKDRGDQAAASKNHVSDRRKQPAAEAKLE